MANTIYSKEFGKADFFKAVITLAEAYDGDIENLADNAIACAEYELDKLAAEKAKAAEKRGTSAGSTDRMCSEFAGALGQALLSVITAEPKTAEELVAALAGKTINGKAIVLSPWVYSVLGGLAGTGKTGSTITDAGKKNINPDGKTVKETLRKTSKTDSKGLIKEALVKAYALA